MKIVIIGYGWVGQANALALSLDGEDVHFFDPAEPEHHYTDQYSESYNKIKKLSSPLEQDGMDTCYLVCVGDRVSESGEQDVSNIEKALTSIEGAQGMVVLRSTILPQTLKNLSFDFYLPEFLHEKKAVEECRNPALFVLGVKSEKKLPEFLTKWEALASRKFMGTPEEASYIKYLSNIWNALQIAFVNEFGDLLPTESNNKIIDFFFEGRAYRRYGKGFDGHCLPKDIRAFIGMAQSEGRSALILEAAKQANDIHKKIQEEKNLNEWYSEWK